MLNRIKAEPVVIAAFVRAVILAVTAFGLQLSAEQIAAIMLVVEASLALFTRKNVTPVNEDDDPAPSQD